MKLLNLVAVLWLTLSGVVSAADNHAAIRKALAAVVPDAAPDQILATPVPGLYEVSYGPQLFYVSEDGRYLLQGSLVDLSTRTNLTEQRQGGLRQAALAKLGDDDMITFAAAKPRHTVTIFTDIDCGYCRKLHNEINELNDLGITVHYLFFPRSGPDTPSYFKAESVWCAKDRNTALTEAKAGKDLPRASCETPLKEHMALVRDFGLNGTPAIVLEDGRILPGYVPAKKLAAMLDNNFPH